MFDAYTIKKVLPRLAIAVILIQLSWFIFTGMIILVNSISYGIEALIYAPFGSPVDFTLQALLSNLDSSFTTLGTTAFVAIAGVGFGGGILAIVGFILIAIGVAFLALALRRILLILLVLLAPLALVAWILPNTERLWKMWWDNFSKLLLMYPMIIGMIAAGRVLAKIAGETGGSDIVATVIVLGGFFIPFVLIPKTFSLAGSAFASIGGAIAQRGAGIQQKTQGWGRARQGAKWKDRHQRAGSNSLFSNSSRLGRKANTAASWAVDPYSNLAHKTRNSRIPFLSARGRKVGSEIEHATLSQSEKLFKELNDAGYNDKAYRAIAGLHDGLSDETKAKLDQRGLLGVKPTSAKQVQGIAEVLAESDSDGERIAANAMMGSVGRLESLYSDPEMTKANIAAAGGMGLASHGFASSEDLAQLGNNLQSGPGAVSGDAAQGLVTRAQLYGQKSRPDVKAGYGITVSHGADGSVQFTDGMSEAGGRGRALLSTLTASDIAGAKGGFFKDMGGQIRSTIEDGRSAKGQAAAQIVSSLRTQGLSSSQIKEHLALSTPNGFDDATDVLDHAEANRIHGSLIDGLRGATHSLGGGSIDIKAQAGALLDDLGLAPPDPNDPSVPPPSTGGGGGDPGAGPTAPGPGTPGPSTP